MKILHLMLSCFYIDNANYQENALPRQNRKDGHEVKIIASTEVFIKNSMLGYTHPRSYINEDGISVERLPYINIFHKSISKKVRAYPNLYRLIADFAPDIILFHGAAAYALITVAKYKRGFPHVKFFVDSHEDFHNSATNIVSKQILHKFFYRAVIQKCLPYIDKVLYITYDTLIFLKEAYNIPDKNLLFFPLGGIIPKSGKRENVRKKIRAELGIGEDYLLLIHSGKLDARKRTADIVSAFLQVPQQKLRLIIIGSMDEDVSASTMPLINSDSRIRYLGWLDKDSIEQYLCAGDLYVQLRGQSVTMQQALCCGCAAALYPYTSHRFLLNDSVFYIESREDLAKVIRLVSTDRQILEMKRRESFKIAKDVLDYQRISTMFLQ